MEDDEFSYVLHTTYVPVPSMSLFTFLVLPVAAGAVIPVRVGEVPKARAAPPHLTSPQTSESQHLVLIIQLIRTARHSGTHCQPWRLPRLLRKSAKFCSLAITLHTGLPCLANCRHCEGVLDEQHRKERSLPRKTYRPKTLGATMNSLICSSLRPSVLGRTRCT